MELKSNKCFYRLSVVCKLRYLSVQGFFERWSNLHVRCVGGLSSLRLSVCVLLCIQISEVKAEPIAIPVHSLPHPCNDRGFPLVLHDGILGCNKDGETGLWMNVETQQTHVLSKGYWAQGSVLFQAGMESGLWDIHSETWHHPRRRIVQSVLEGQLYATTESILWTDAQDIHQLDIHTGQVRQRQGHPLQGTHPVPYGEQVAWLEWGSQMGVHLWHPVDDTHIWIASEYPSSLIQHRSQLSWVSEGKIMVWSSSTGLNERLEQNVKEVFSTERGVCWTQWVNDIDILCDGGFHLERKGHQGNPVWRGEALYFTESDTLWIYKSMSIPQ